MSSIGTTRVEELMVTAIVMVEPTDKMEFVAKLFDEQDIHAAPVVNKAGECIGLITSHDIVEYEAVQREMYNEINHGTIHNIANYCGGMEFRMPGQYFDEVGFHMTKSVDSACVDDPLSKVARSMCTNHRHHVLVLDDDSKPIGMLSSLDLLGFVIGEPVCRDRKPAEQNSDEA